MAKEGLKSLLTLHGKVIIHFLVVYIKWKIEKGIFIILSGVSEIEGWFLIKSNFSGRLF